MINRSCKLLDKLLNIYTAQNNELPVDQKKMINVLNRPENITLGFIDDDLAPLEGDKEGKLEPEETITERMKLNPRKRKIEGTWLKILTSSKLLTRIEILLAETKAENNLNKLKNEIAQILYLLYEHNIITKKVYNSLIKSI